MDLPIAVGLASATVTLLALAILVFLFVCRRCGHREDDLERGPSNTHVADGLDDAMAEQAKSAVRRFGWAEVESLTRRFSSEGVIGEGGFSTVYLASLPDSSLAAIKVHRSAASERLLQAFQQELDLLVRLHHPHIIRLLGYCNVREEGVMVLEYISNGSLHDKLHGGGEALPWARRTSIAYRVAQALEYLHEHCDPQVVHGDIKAANVLLDHLLEPKLCDFGCARAGFSGAVQPPCRTTRSIMTGSLGYVDPHYLRTGVVSKKSDVYSFGVLLLELLTGSEAFCAERERPLTWLVGPRLFEAEENGMGELVDSRLGGKYDTAEAAALASLAARCIGEQPSLRPSIAEVVRIMAEKMPSALMPIIHATSRETSRRNATTTSKSL